MRKMLWDRLGENIASLQIEMYDRNLSSSKTVMMDKK